LDDMALMNVNENSPFMQKKKGGLNVDNFKRATTYHQKEIG